MYHQKVFKTKDIHKYAKDHLTDWFPRLGSYQSFNNRLNRLCIVMNTLTEHLIEEFKPLDCCSEQNLLDSMPIITCSGKRKGKVAKEITDKGYCCTKSMLFPDFDIRLHYLL